MLPHDVLSVIADKLYIHCIKGRRDISFITTISQEDCNTVAAYIILKEYAGEPLCDFAHFVKLLIRCRDYCVDLWAMNLMHIAIQRREIQAFRYMIRNFINPRDGLARIKIINYIVDEKWKQGIGIFSLVQPRLRYFEMENIIKYMDEQLIFWTINDVNPIYKISRPYEERYI
jgi:hypothetical protein